MNAQSHEFSVLFMACAMNAAANAAARRRARAIAAHYPETPETL